jgi:hypothetical protein
VISAKLEEQDYLMSGFKKIVGTLLISTVLGVAGYGYAKALLADSDAIFETFEQTNSGWLYSDKIGAPSASSLLRARVAIGGPLGLSASEVAYFIAVNDSVGDRLTSSCTYRVDGKPIDTRWWSLTLYDSQTLNFVPNDAKRSSWNSVAIPRQEDGSWRVIVSGATQPGNWLPSQAVGDLYFELQLRTYVPSAQTRSALPNIGLPLVEKVSC